MKTFYNKVLSTEGNIFEAYTTGWLPFKKALLNGLWNVVSKHEGQNTLQILPETIAKVADTVEEIEGVRVQVIGIKSLKTRS